MKSRKNRRPVIGILLAMLMAVQAFMLPSQVGGTITAQASNTTAYDILSVSSYAKCYTLSDSGITIPYTDKSLSTPGTVTNGASSGAYISNVEDVLWLKEVGEEGGSYWALVSYPITGTNRRLDAYIPLSAISRNDAASQKAVATGQFYCFPRETSRSTSNSYYVDKGDTVYLLSAKDDRCQILYPVSGGLYRIAFCRRDDYIRYCGEINAGIVEDGTYVIQSGNDNSKVLDIEGFNLKNGANLQIYENNWTTNQKFYITGLGDGYYKIAALHSNKVLDVEYMSPLSGANVHQYKWHGGMNQQWMLKDAGDGYYYIISRLGTALDNSGGNAVNGNNVCTYKQNFTDAQKWKLVAVDTGAVSEGIYMVESGNSADRVLDINNFSTENGGNLEIYQKKDTDTANQEFEFCYQGNGYYQIVSVHSGKALDVEYQSAESGANCHQWDVHDGDSQLWQLVDAGGGYYYIRSKLGCYLDNSNGSTELSNNVVLYEYNGSDAQRWKLNYIGKAVENERETVVEYMRQMATVQWTPAKTITYWSGGRKWTAGVTYYGVPYSQRARTTTLEAFCGKLNGTIYEGPTGQSTYMGTDCSSSISLAWKQVNADFSMRYTGTLRPSSAGMRKVGEYTVKRNSEYTATTCANNGSTVMYDAYRQLQPGDALLAIGKSGHVMMVTSVSDNSVTVIEQTTYDKNLRSTWRVDKEYSFQTLYKQGYIPVTMDIW